jgi:DNA-binding NarL/FixJ family response regulator
MKVLLVADSSAMRGLVRVLFESDTTFEVCGEAENGQEGIEKAAELRPDLIVIDLSMPVLNGLDATRGIKRLLPNVQVILFSAYSNSLTPEEARIAGISALVSKSEPSALIEVAHAVLRQNAA